MLTEARAAGVLGDVATGRESAHVRHIDGLRAVAVLAVLLYHVHPSWMPGGFVGVDVFFVISGFVVSGSLFRSSNRGYLSAFYSRRLRRIAPALVVCLVVTGVFTAMFVPRALLSQTIQETGHRAFFGLSNWSLIHTSSSYFAPSTELNPYTHTWSLGVEEQFYLVFPLLFLAWISTRRRRWASVVLIGGAAVGSLLFAITASSHNAAEAFYSLPARFWQLAAGALLFQVTSLLPVPDHGRRYPWAGPAAAVSAALLAAGLWLARPGHSPWPDGILPVIGTVGLLLALRYAGPTPVRRLLDTRVLVGTGLISYSLYLWHWPTIVLFRWTVGLSSLTAQAAAVAVAFAAALVSYWLVETPFRYGRVVKRLPRYALIVLVLAGVYVSMRVHTAIAHREDRLAVSTVAKHSADWYPSTPSGVGVSECSNLTAGGMFSQAFGRSCDPTPSNGRLFVLGDSHALMYERMLMHTAQMTGRQVFVAYRQGCAFANLVPGFPLDGPLCTPYDSAVLSKIAEEGRPGDVLFLSALRLPRLSTDTRSGSDAELRSFIAEGGRSDRRAEVLAVRSALAPLLAGGVRVVFGAPTPLFESPTFRCADWFDRANPVCRGGLVLNRAEFDSLRAPVLAAYAQIEYGMPGISVWDPAPELCGAQACDAIVGGRPLFFDGDHLSGHGDDVVTAGFIAFIGKVGEIPSSAVGRRLNGA